MLAHNASPGRCALIAELGEEALKGKHAAHIIPQNGWKWAPDSLHAIIKRVKDKGLIHDLANLFPADPGGQAGTHTMRYVERLIDVMDDWVSRDKLLEGIAILRREIMRGKF